MVISLVATYSNRTDIRADKQIVEDSLTSVTVASKI